MNMTRSAYLMFNLLFSMIVVASDGHVFSVFVFSLLQMFLMSGRLEDIGMTKWWLLTYIIPVINSYVCFMALFAPTGYKKLSHVNYGKIDSCFVSGLIIVSVIIMSIVYLIATGR